MLLVIIMAIIGGSLMGYIAWTDAREHRLGIFDASFAAACGVFYGALILGLMTIGAQYLITKVIEAGMVWWLF